jgi:hypothetical protein
MDRDKSDPAPLGVTVCLASTELQWWLGRTCQSTARYDWLAGVQRRLTLQRAWIPSPVAEDPAFGH